MHARRDMRESLLCALMASCAWSEPTGPAENTASQAEGEICRIPPVRCYPLQSDPQYCGLACGNVLAYCPDYPDSAYVFCYTHIGYPGRCGPIGEPLYPTECLLGAPAAPPSTSDSQATHDLTMSYRKRINIITLARKLAEHGLVDQAREMFARVGISYAADTAR